MIERKLRKDVSVLDGFMPGRSTIEAIYLLKRLMGLYRDRKVDLHMMFIDLEKAYDRALHEDMYEGGRTSVRMPGGVTDDFFVGMGLHQGSTLSPFLSILVMDELTQGIQDELPWCMLFADDIILIDHTKERVNGKLE